MSTFYFNDLNTSLVATGTLSARSLQDRFTDIVNVKDFGAKGDGVTDDTAAIQAAIDSGYRSIRLPRGTYNVSAELILPSTHPVLIEGDGIWPVTIVKATAAMRSVFYRGTTTLIGGGFRGLNIEASQQADYGLFIEAGKNGIYEDILVTNAKVAEGLFGNAATPRFFENKFINASFYTASSFVTDPNNRPDYNVHLIGFATDNEFIRCGFANAKLANLRIDPGGNAVAFCHFYGSPSTYEATYCLQLNAQSRAIGNYFDGFTTAGVHINASKSSVVSNMFYWPSTTTGDGILVATGLSSVSIAANQFDAKPAAKAEVAYAGTNPADSQILDGHLYSSGQKTAIGTNGGLGTGTTPRLLVAGTDFGSTLTGLGRWSDDNGSAFLSFYKSRGTVIGTNSIVQVSDVVGAIDGVGYDGSAFATTARVLFRVNDSPSAGSMPGRIEFLTTPSGSVSPSQRMFIDDKGNVVINIQTIATTATDGFLYIPSCAGTPTGTPTTHTGMVPMCVDSTNHKLYFYSGGQWRDAGP